MRIVKGNEPADVRSYPMRTSATVLESFRLFMQPEQEWMSEDDLIATIRGQVVPTDKVRLGKAFGQVLEEPLRFCVPGGYACDGYQFSAETMAAPLALMDHRYGVFEPKQDRLYGDVLVVSKADQMVGAHLFEHKTTDSFDVDKYAASYQWRLMVDATGARIVTYHVFVLDDHGNGVVDVKSIETVNFYPYEELHADCVELVGQFREFVIAKRLDGFLRERQRRAERAA